MPCFAFRPFEPDEHTVLALLDRGVWVHPGYFFGMPDSGWLVLQPARPGVRISYWRNHPD